MKLDLFLDTKIYIKIEWNLIYFYIQNLYKIWKELTALSRKL